MEPCSISTLTSGDNHLTVSRQDFQSVPAEASSGPVSSPEMKLATSVPTTPDTLFARYSLAVSSITSEDTPILPEAVTESMRGEIYRQVQSPFFRLPKEIRDIIYEQVVTMDYHMHVVPPNLPNHDELRRRNKTCRTQDFIKAEWGIACAVCHSPAVHNSMNLLKVCKSMYDETRRSVYEVSTFVIEKSPVATYKSEFMAMFENLSLHWGLSVPMIHIGEIELILGHDLSATKASKNIKETMSALKTALIAHPDFRVKHLKIMFLDQHFSSPRELLATAVVLGMLHPPETVEISGLGMLLIFWGTHTTHFTDSFLVECAKTPLQFPEISLLDIDASEFIPGKPFIDSEENEEYWGDMIEGTTLTSFQNYFYKM